MALSMTTGGTAIGLVLLPSPSPPLVLVLAGVTGVKFNSLGAAWILNKWFAPSLARRRTRGSLVAKVVVTALLVASVALIVN